MLHPAVFRGFSCCPCSLRHRAGQQSSIRDIISTALTTADLPANACRTPPDNDIARGAGLLQRGFPGWRSPAGCGGVGFCLARQRHRPGGRAPTGVFLFGGVLRVVVAWVSALRGNDIARRAGLLQRGFPVWRCLAGCGGMASFLASQGFRPPSRASAPRSSAWRAALPVGARPPGLSLRVVGTF